MKSSVKVSAEWRREYSAVFINVKSSSGTTSPSSFKLLKPRAESQKVQPVTLNRILHGCDVIQLLQLTARRLLQYSTAYYIKTNLIESHPHTSVQAEVLSALIWASLLYQDNNNTEEFGCDHWGFCFLSLSVVLKLYTHTWTSAALHLCDDFVQHHMCVSINMRYCSCWSRGAEVIYVLPLTGSLHFTLHYLSLFAWQFY